MKSGRLDLSISGVGDQRSLIVTAPHPSALHDFDGSAVQSATETVLVGPLSAANAAAVRAHVPSLRPVPVGLNASAGTGDRLGVATPGHVRAFRRSGAGLMPVFAQQSIREMDRLGRSPQQVLDDATFGCLQAEWNQPVGADADHLKSTADIDRCLEAGFVSFTLDPGELVREVGDQPTEQQLADVPWAQLEDDLDSMVRRYAGYSLDLGDGRLHASEAEVRRAAAKYGAAIAHVSAMYRHLMDRAPYEVEVEVAVDETDDVTTYAEHLYLATEMKRLGMSWVGFAPRYLGLFEKGVDYIGDLDDLRMSLVRHAEIARILGPYKLSLHSGSDKFSIYDVVADATGGLVHLKTSGTSYLVAVEMAARFAPDLFREIYRVSRDAYRNSRATYYVSAQLDATPEPDAVADDGLPELVVSPQSRQILHVGYGAVLRTPDERGPSAAAGALMGVLAENSEAYGEALEIHIGNHLAPFSRRASVLG